MVNKFLDNVNLGRNKLWMYIVTIVLSFIVANLLASFLLPLGQLFFWNVSEATANQLYFFFFMSLNAIFQVLFLYISIKYIHKRDFMTLINISGSLEKFKGLANSWFNRIRWNRILKGFLVWIAFLFIMELVYILVNPAGVYINLSFENIGLLIILFLVSIPIQITFEELFFRGYLNQGLSLKIKSPLIVILISSFIFGCGHLANGGDVTFFIIQNFVITFIMGFIWSTATLIDNGIELAIGAHFANNFFAFFISSSSASFGGFKTLISITGFTPLGNFVINFGVLIVFALILFFYKKEDILKAWSKDKSLDD